MVNIDKISDENKFVINSNGKEVGYVVVEPWFIGEQNKISGNFLQNGITTDSIEEIEKKIYEEAGEKYKNFEVI